MRWEQVHICSTQNTTVLMLVDSAVPSKAPQYHDTFFRHRPFLKHLQSKQSTETDVWMRITG